MLATEGSAAPLRRLLTGSPDDGRPSWLGSPKDDGIAL